MSNQNKNQQSQQHEQQFDKQQNQSKNSKKNRKSQSEERMQFTNSRTPEANFEFQLSRQHAVNKPNITLRLK